jgi:hypothetical protein
MDFYLKYQLLRVLHSMDYWTSCLYKCQPLDILYFDFEKTFDRVPHRRLIHKLEHNGIGECYLLGLKPSYLIGPSK